MPVATSHDDSRKKPTLCRTLHPRIAMPRCDTVADHNVHHVPFKQTRHVADPNMTDSVMSAVWDVNADNRTIAECKLIGSDGKIAGS